MQVSEIVWQRGAERHPDERRRWGGERNRFWNRPTFVWLALLAPALILMVGTMVYPAVDSIINSFRSNGRFVGFDNYSTIFSDSNFWVAFRNNLILLISIPIRIVLALVLAALIFRGMAGSRLYETALFLPYIPSIAAIGVIFVYMLNTKGPVNGVLGTLGLGTLQHGWLTEPGFAMWSIMGVVVWSRFGFTFIIFSARLAAIDRSIFQAAFVDGASWARTFRHVALPQLKGAVEFVAVLSVVEVFAWSFAYVYVLAQGANDSSNHILEIYLYNRVFLANLPGLAAAVAVFIMLVVGALVIYRFRRTPLEAD